MRRPDSGERSDKSWSPVAAAEPANGGDASPLRSAVEPPESLGQGDPLRILVLADRCWAHPQGGGTGANLYAQVRRWAAAGHLVTVIAGDYPGAERLEHVVPRLIVHRMGGRATVFPLGAWAVMRGLGRDADVVLEIVNGITFLTPLWLRKPRVALVCHPHRELYVGEFGRFRGRVLAALAEELPLRLLYRRAPFLTISESARDDLVHIDGIPRSHIAVAYCGVEPGLFGPSQRHPEPRLLYLGRLKAYKRIEHVLDVLEAIPGATLDIVGEGDHREALEAEIERRRLGERVTLYGHVDDATRAEMYGRAWILLTASSSEGWGLTVIEAALCGTPSAALAVGGLRESIVDGETGVLAQNMDELTRRVQELMQDADERARLGEAARRRALTFTWERTAATNLAALRAHIPSGARAALATSPPDPALPAESGLTSGWSSGRPPSAAWTRDRRTGRAEQAQDWRMHLERSAVEDVLFAFLARRIMTVTNQRPGLVEFKGGSALAVGKRARALDWLPVRGRISFVPDTDGHFRVRASIWPRGRPHVRRHLFAGLYEQKLTSWLAELDRAIRRDSAAGPAGVGGVAPTPPA